MDRGWRAPFPRPAALAGGAAPEVPGRGRVRSAVSPKARARPTAHSTGCLTRPCLAVALVKAGWSRMARSNDVMLRSRANAAASGADEGVAGGHGIRQVAPQLGDHEPRRRRRVGHDRDDVGAVPVARSGRGRSWPRLSWRRGRTSEAARRQAPAREGAGRLGDVALAVVADAEGEQLHAARGRSSRWGGRRRWSRCRARASWPGPWRRPG